MQACVELVKDVCSTLMYILYYNVMYIHVFLLSLLLYIILSPSCILSVVRERVFVDVDVSRYPNSSMPDGKTNLLIIKYIGYQRSPQLWWSPRRILSMNEIVLIFFFFFWYLCATVLCSNNIILCTALHTPFACHNCIIIYYSYHSCNPPL